MINNNGDDDDDGDNGDDDDNDDDDDTNNKILFLIESFIISLRHALGRLFCGIVYIKILEIQNGWGHLPKDCWGVTGWPLANGPDCAAAGPGFSRAAVGTSLAAVGASLAAASSK